MPSEQHTSLDRRLVLLAWLNRQFGYEQNRDLLVDMREADEGFDAYGHSSIYHRLISRGDKIKIPPEILAKYDKNIHKHLMAMNALRSEPIVLRYFQHLAAWYTEYALDSYFNRPGQTVSALNDFARAHNAHTSNQIAFSKSDLRKLAFWMATGSGKTLIMHLNYRQFLHYNDQQLDNILLITPNEGLSTQHIEEMTASNIPCRRFERHGDSLMSSTREAVQVIEITKLTEQKRGGGVSVPVEAFEGNNLIFVDEGHKGSGGEAWRRVREELGKTGYTFEYSATFGQALSSAGNDALTIEYGKAIAFDYSYRYFHGDGYGKDFRVLNLNEETTSEYTDLLLLGNLLSFYEQQCLFEARTEALRTYGLERPLSLFIGRKVNDVYNQSGEKQSDVLTVARFLHCVLSKPDWAAEAIGRLLEGETGLCTPHGQDVFGDQFGYLRAMNQNPQEIYRDLLTCVFHAPTSGGLHLCAIRGSDGEIGLKASTADTYFGLIYIGDSTAFRNLAGSDDSGIVVEEDALTGGLFNDINSQGTTINVLIGAKRFIEGWDSYRVSNMGLLNVGKSEGSEIIQLFGRGVRLRGKDRSLKRSASLSGVHPDRIELLETLNIYAVRANYMAQFQVYLNREGIDTEGYIDLPLTIRSESDLSNMGLLIPRIPADTDFAREEDLALTPDHTVQVRVDVSTRVQTLESGVEGVETTVVQAGTETILTDDLLELIDWERVYIELLEYKHSKDLKNLYIQPSLLRSIISDNLHFTLIADDDLVHPKSFEEVARLQEVVTTILRRYVDAFYRSRQRAWESNRMIYKILDEHDPNLRFNHLYSSDGKGQYIVSVRRSEDSMIEEIENLISGNDRIYQEESAELPRLHFDRHLYQPLLIEQNEKVKSTPPALTKSERAFVTDLKEYWVSEKDKSLLEVEVFLLRNLSRGTGVGFFESSGFYPDFILWIKETGKQHIVFIEPHGMIHAEAYEHDEKAQLHVRLPDMAKKIGERSGRDDITLDSYVISATRFQDLRKRYSDGTWDMERFAEAHILFAEQYNYLSQIFEAQLST
ncbi:MAG: DEAD/DEAH box helicase family protein [Gemmatimonadetes bacterium]|nr:DEAD/DEAH box helicase family protein [Gemmatimonadota bacterium]